MIKTYRKIRNLMKIQEEISKEHLILRNSILNNFPPTTETIRKVNINIPRLVITSKIKDSEGYRSDNKS